MPYRHVIHVAEVGSVAASSLRVSPGTSPRMAGRVINFIADPGTLLFWAAGRHGNHRLCQVGGQILPSCAYTR
jgi:hypothetical protein